MAAFLAVFALDSFAPGTPLSRAIPAFAIHLIPSAVVLAIVGIAWHWPIAGGLAFLGVAAAYALTVPTGRLDWIAVIAGPLVAVGLMFLWSGLRLRARA
jgi:hypothetical protein